MRVKKERKKKTVFSCMISRGTGVGLHMGLCPKKCLWDTGEQLRMVPTPRPRPKATDLLFPPHHTPFAIHKVKARA